MSAPSQDAFTERWKAALTAADKRGGTPAMIEAIEAWIAEIEQAAATADPHEWRNTLAPERRALDDTLDQLRENRANRQAGRHILQDGSQAYVTPDGHISSAYSSVSFEEPDGHGGTVTVDTGGPGRHRRHTEAVRAFRRSPVYRREVRRLRPAVATTRCQPRPRGAGRPRAQATRSSARSGDSPDGEPGSPPPLRALGSGRLRHCSYGVEKLLRKLAVGLDPAALPAAAQLVLVLDEDAAANLEEVAA